MFQSRLVKAGRVEEMEQTFTLAKEELFSAINHACATRGLGTQVEDDLRAIVGDYIQ